MRHRDTRERKQPIDGSCELAHLREAGEDQLVRELLAWYPASYTWEQRLRRAYEDGVIDSGQATSLLGRYCE